MSRTIIFLALIVTVFFGVGFSAEERIATPEKAGDGSDLKGKDHRGIEVVIRLYENIIDKPDVFEKISLRANEGSRWFEYEFDDAKESSFVVIAESDQHDVSVKKVLGKSVGGWPCKDRKRVILPRKPFTGHRMIVKDAIGNVLADAKVEVVLRAWERFGVHEFSGSEMTADANGVCMSPEVYGDLKFSHYIVEHRNFGKAVYKKQSSNVLLPLVELGTEAYDRSIRGWVVDPFGNPVAGASVRCQFAFTLGDVKIFPAGGIPYKVLTNEKGFFSMYLPPNKVHKDRPNRGHLIPPGTNYDVHIAAPDQYRLLPYIGKINNSKEVAIELEDAGPYHTFVFEDGNERISDAKILSGLYVTIERDGKPDLWHINWKDGGFFPHGVYRAQIYAGGYRDEFEPLVVDENSPEELVFSFRRSINCRGQVVNAMTRMPVKGAFVVGAISTSSSRDLCQITDGQWEQMRNLGDYPDIEDPLLGPLRDICHFNAISRTGEDGKFSFDFFPVGNYYRMLVFEKDFLAILYIRKLWKGNSDGFLELPVTKLYPSGSMTVEATADEKPKSMNAIWLVNKDSIPEWAEGILSIQSLALNNGVYPTEAGIYFAHRQRRSNKHSFPVPAGFDLRIRLDTAWDTLWCPVSIDETVMLEQGQSLDLGVWPLVKAYPAKVRVVNSLGEPVEGIPVKAQSDVFTSRISNTDKQGMARIYVPPDFTGDFVVQYGSNDANRTHLQKAKAYEISGSDDGNSVLTIVLSDD